MAHVDAHRAFMSSMLVKNNPQVMVILQGHIMDHVSIQAREEVEEESKAQIEQVSAQFGGQVPEELQLQMQEEIESQVSEKIAEMTDEMVAEEAEMLQQMSEDPLVGLKQQEINLRAQDLQRKSMVDEAKIGIDEQKLRQDAQIAQDRIDSQEDIAQLRANVNLTKQKEIEKSKKRPRTVDVNKNIRFDN
jgi:hypothetical protein